MMQSDSSDANIITDKSDECTTTKVDSPTNETSPVVLSIDSESKTLNGDGITTRAELWAFYVYYIVSNALGLTIFCDGLSDTLDCPQGNNGLSGFNYGPSQFQNLLFLAGYDPSQPPFTTPCGAGSCVLPYMGQTRDSQY